jgi:dienelactone hydrolase
MLNLPELQVEQNINIKTPKAIIEGTISGPEEAVGIILFAHSAGSSRLNPQNQYIAESLHQDGFATLMIDLLTPEEERLDVLGKLSFDIPLLAGRLDCAADWVSMNDSTAHLKIGYFGVGTGAAAALLASLQRPDTLGAIVARGGRIDLAEHVLPEVKPPTLFIVEQDPPEQLNRNRRLARKMLTEKKLVAMPGASWFFEQPEHLNEIAELTTNWFRQHLTGHRLYTPKERPYSHIDSCSFGRIRVDGKDYTRDLIVFPEKQVMDWWRKDQHRVSYYDVKEVIRRKPDMLIVGTGTLGNLKLDASMRKMVRKYNITIREDRTQSAIALFSRFSEKGIKAAGAFHLTC